MLNHDLVPWLMAQEGLPALRARRLLGLRREGDDGAVLALERGLAREQQADGSLDHSAIKTAGVLNLVHDLRTTHAQPLIAAAASYLFSVLAAQPGYGRARDVEPGALRTPCDLGGFFGPYAQRSEPQAMADGAREMNYLRQYEPLLGPQSPVRAARTSSRGRAGPGSCYAWGLIPLSYTIEALCRSGYAGDERLQPAIHALLGAQRESGGWCRNLGGHPGCTRYAVRALGAHPDLRRSPHAERTLGFMRATQLGALGRDLARWWTGAQLFASLQAVAAFDLPVAREIIADGLSAVIPRQRRDGTFGGSNPVERVTAVMVATRAIGPTRS